MYLIKNDTAILYILIYYKPYPDTPAGCLPFYILFRSYNSNIQVYEKSYIGHFIHFDILHSECVKGWRILF
jgi:hypothetical protein